VTRLETSAGVPLIDDFDADALLASIPDDYERKGMLFARHAKALGYPPNQFDPLLSYPAREYFRLFNLVAEQAFPGEPRAQQWRLLARREIESVTNSSRRS
jgi:hypothetical protein